jgi:serine phosphatase RsbU (regulator of sigma subunit)
MDRFKEIIKKNAKLKTAQDIYNAILADVKQFMGSYPQADDITLLVLKVRD